MPLHAETRNDGDKAAADVASVYFWSLPDQFKLTMSVSAAAGKASIMLPELPTNRL
jgi:hypothetical protein